MARLATGYLDAESYSEHSEFNRHLHTHLLSQESHRMLSASASMIVFMSAVLATNPPSLEATLLLIILSMASHSPCRTQGPSLALAVIPSVEARSASSGVLELAPLRYRGAWTSTAPTFTQRTATIRPSVSPSAVLKGA